ncbi:hypothetical protein AB0N60_36715 [Streptomyces microflavus]|uniref:hypothetical protein n=1 Tax=Streptomyces microflavus TaxID=1919 RepID=UPI00343D0C92
MRGRQAAFRRAYSNLRDWHNPVEEDDPEADELAQALQDSPFIDVVHAMTRLGPGLAPKIVGQRTVPALDAWRTAFGI